jgi:hypothetical protein
MNCTADKKVWAGWQIYPNLDPSWDRFHEPSQFPLGPHRDPVVVPPMHPHAVDITRDPWIASKWEISTIIFYWEKLEKLSAGMQCFCTAPCTNVSYLSHSTLHFVMYFDQVERSVTMMHETFLWWNFGAGADAGT